jgi:hypothetical protein
LAWYLLLVDADLVEVPVARLTRYLKRGRFAKTIHKAAGIYVGEWHDPFGFHTAVTGLKISYRPLAKPLADLI